MFRSAYRPKNKHIHPSPNVSTPAAGDFGGTGSGATSGPPLPRLRTAHPRPYLPSFRGYLFAPETQAWLDVMIWSSAQPHSVQGMVERVFGAEAYAEGMANNSLGNAAIGVVKGAVGEDVSSAVMDGTAQDQDVESMDEKEGSRPRLVAIWARDTLGLSDSHYCTSLLFGTMLSDIFTHPSPWYHLNVRFRVLKLMSSTVVHTLKFRRFRQLRT